MSEQPEALWLADFLDAEANVLDEGRPPDLKSTKRRAAAELRRQHAVIAELLKALRYCVGVLEQVDCSTGVCCCGSDMQNHGMDDGHSPVDQGQYAQSGAIENGRAAIARAEGVKP